MHAITTKGAFQNAIDYARKCLGNGNITTARNVMISCLDTPWGREPRRRQGLLDAIKRVEEYQQAISYPNPTTKQVTPVTLPTTPGLPSWVKSLPTDDADMVLFAKGFDTTKATMVEAQSSIGGFAVPQSVADRIMGRVLQSAVVRPRATLIPATSDQMTVGVVTGGNDANPSNLRGQWVAEGQAAQAPQALTVGASKAPLHIVKTRVLMTKSLLEDSPPVVLSTLETYAGAAILNEQDRVFLGGTGVNEPLGILALQAPGVLANDAIRVTTSGSNTTVTADSVISLIYSVPGVYRDAPGFCVGMTSSTLQVVRGLKDSAGRFIFDSDTRRLSGYPVAESEQFPEIAQNAYPILAGDVSGYQISDKGGLTVTRYDSGTVVVDGQRVALYDLDAVLFEFRQRLGGQPVTGYRFAALKVSA